MKLFSKIQIQSTLLSALALASCLALTSCNSGGKFSKNADGVVRPLADDVVLAKFKGGTITGKDVKEMAGPQIQKLQEEAIETYQQIARQMVLQKVIEAKAAAAKMSAQEFMANLPGSAQVTDAQVEEFFKTQPELKKGVKNPRTGKIEKVSTDDVKRFLESQSRRAAQQSFVEAELASAEVQILLEATPPPPVDVKNQIKPAFLGSKNAKVVIHEFSDFQCFYCGKAKGVVKQIADAYGDKVRIEYRHFPLDGHKEAMPAAVASVCATEQDKFWPYHDKLFDNQQNITESNLKAWAKELELDVAKFEACLKSPETSKVVEFDLNEARRLGVNSTPTFIVNGRKVAGAQPFEEFKKIIDSELKK